MTRTALRILILTPAFPPEIGGQEDHLHELSESLMALGASVRVITRRLRADFLRQERVGTVPVLRLSPIGEFRGTGWRAIGPLTLFVTKVLYHLLRDARRYDAVLVSGFNILPVAAVVASALTRKPCVVRAEAPTELRSAVGSESLRKMGLAQDSFLTQMISAAYRRVAARVDRFVAISAEMRDGLMQAGIAPGKIVSIPNGIDTALFSPPGPNRRQALRAALGLPKAAHVIIYTGRLATSKGVMMLADIWRELSTDFPDWHLLLIGTGKGSGDSCEDELRQFIADHALANRVTLAGNVGNVHEYLQTSDLFAFPSDYEGFGLSIIEAMSVGLPIVSTRVGVATDVVTRSGAGLLVPPKDRGEFALALRHLIECPALRTTLGLKAQAAIQTEFSMQSVAARHLAVLAELADSGSHTSGH